MRSFCFCLSLRTGCLVVAPLYFIFAVIKIVLLVVRPVQEGPQALIVINVVMLIVCGVLLLVGVIKEDRVCILTYICFNISALIIEAIGLLIQYIVLINEEFSTWLIVFLVIEYIPFLYMIFIGVFEYLEVREKHMRRVEPYMLNVNRHPSTKLYDQPPPSIVPGLGF